MIARTESVSPLKTRRVLPRFVHEFFQSPTTTGAVCASSPFLAARLADAVKLDQARSILEVGPGSGAVTECLVNRMPKHARLTAIEINPRFAECIRKRFPAVRVIAGGAEELDRFMGEHRIEAFDCVVSSLPWAALPLPLQAAILEQIHRALRPGGEMVTYAYFGFHWLPAGHAFRKRLRSKFPAVRSSSVIWANLPPAFVYHARK